MELKKIKDIDKVNVTLEMTKTEYDFIKDVKIFSIDCCNDRVIVETLNEQTGSDMYEFLRGFFKAIRKGE